MTQLRDPYGVLGLPRGASLDDVKRAYRRLAKEHHPDSGGERTLKRFLEIQAAYEQLVHGRPGAGVPTGNAPRRAPWQADPVRADATRRAYGSRGRRTGTRETGQRQPDGKQAGEEPRRRGPRKATLGSTSYDEAADQPFDPDWAGSSWYGTTSGTYWTLNPREYADPRKHGPEYQARARRQAGAGEPLEDDGGGVDVEEEPAAAAKPASEPEPSAGPGWRPAAETSTGTEWSATPGTIDRTPVERDATPAVGASPGERRRAPASAGSSPAAPPPGLGDLVRLLDPRISRSPGGRLWLALAGGVPIAIWLAWLLGELTGCGRFAATCEPQVVTAAWIAGFVLVVALVLLPAAAAILVAGAGGALLAAIPATVFLTATGGARMPEESGMVLGFALIVGWLAGVILSTNYWWRGSGRPGPVS
jgi:DnaJ-like protein